MATVYLGLGTNIGNRTENLTRAIEALSLALGHYTALSSFIETAPWGFDSDNAFLNCAVAFDTELSPFQLLDTTENIERELGRTSKSNGGVYHDRVIDIDILLYGNMTIDTGRLTIPHPLMHMRDFVLEPLAQIAPHTVHPTTGKSIEQLKAALYSDKKG
ncbi:MAG: 2-amino-4-hydroxy-6-hydroxymethyldihydropteridine diphosphokinase [Bacteroidaceae bacterium]|nr:2-amino-4-hydroxy-6-hydroxymethyldihydropteridine diphosphokinase [Bacteroidaceae bacterium]